MANENTPLTDGKEEEDDDVFDEEAEMISNRFESLGASAPYKMGNVPNAFKSFRADFAALKNHNPSVRSMARHRLNIVFGTLLVITFSALATISSVLFYRKSYLPRKRERHIEHAIRLHAEAAALRREQCRGISWETACDRMTGSAGARRVLVRSNEDRDNEIEDQILDSDDPTVIYDDNCLREYRLTLFGNITFPYYATQLLNSGGNQSMALFVQHGALRDPENYFCSFKQLLLEQNYRDFNDIILVAPNFSYKGDIDIHPQDAFWNSSKPWGDWRVGAESDPGMSNNTSVINCLLVLLCHHFPFVVECCGRSGLTISSFSILDHMLAILTSRKLYPRMNKISYVGHSAGAQMVQRYAIMSVLASLWNLDEEVYVEFVVANPSSYTYLDQTRPEYACGECECSTRNCTCDKECTRPPYNTASIPLHHTVGTKHPCYQWNYNRWPYGLGSFSDRKGKYIPYALRDGLLGVERSIRLYQMLHVVYMVGQNDTCNDGLPVCDPSCWKREIYDNETEWPCFRNQMDTRCPAMLQGPCRRTRGHQYMKHLESVYGRPVHKLRTVRLYSCCSCGLHCPNVVLTVSRM